MGVGYVIGPFILIIYCAFLVGIILHPSLEKQKRKFYIGLLLSLPALIIGYAIFDTIQTNLKMRKFPECKKITLAKPIPAIKDSITILKSLVTELSANIQKDTSPFSHQIKYEGISVSNYEQWEHYIPNSSNEQKFRILGILYFLESTKLNKLKFE